MNRATAHGLSHSELVILSKVLSIYADKIDKVGVFGSRATGNYKDYSDIDIVIYSTLSAEETARLFTLFDESSIGLRVDLKNYQAINYLPLKRHIDSCMKILFTKEQLKELADN